MGKTGKNYWRTRLKQFRTEKGWTQQDLEKLSGVSQSQIEMLESGKRPFTQKTLEKLLKALKKDYNDLFAYIDHETLVAILNYEKRKTDKSGFDPREHRKLPANVIDLLKKVS